MYNPLMIFTGAALATMAALMGVTYDKWSDATAHGKLAVSQESKAEPAAPAAALENMGAPAQSAQPSTELASISPEEPAVQQPPSDAPAPGRELPAVESEPAVDDSKPTFDTIRIERDGSAVMAGRGLPDSDVTVVLDGTPLGIAKADPEGAWVLIPDEPVPPGDHQLTLRMQTSSALSVESEQSVALKVPDRPDDEALVVLNDPNAPSRVLQKPETLAGETMTSEVTPNETTIEKAPESVVAGAEPQSASGEKVSGSSLSLTLGTVDYNDRGDIIFSGNAEAGAGVRLYVDNKPVGDAAANSEGAWSFAGKEEIAPGTHSLRVDQLRSDGSVSQRIELPFFRAAPQDVAALNEATAEDAQGADAPSSSAQSVGEPEAPATMGEVEETASEGGQAAVAAAEPPAAEPSAMEESATVEMAPPENPPPSPATPVEQPSEILSAAGDVQQQAAAAIPEPADPGQPRNGKIVIQPGNSLWRISRVIYGRGVEYTVIYDANKDQIRNPNLIYPGQIFATPGVIPPEMIDPASTTPLASSSDAPTSPQ
jgi:nucleoid-associated protein YgaU